MYENGSRANGSSYSCYPDKIVFRQAPGDEGLQITWGRFVTKLINLLEEHPEIERTMIDYDKKQETAKAQEEKEPDIIDADFKEVEEHPEESEEPENQQEEEAESEPTEQLEEVQDPECYTARDVKELLAKNEADLKAYREVEGLPEKLIKKQRILVDALALFLKEIERREEKAYEQD